MDYVTENDENLIRNWYVAQEPSVQAAFDFTLGTLAATRDWTDPRLDEFKILTGVHLGLCEIRFEVEIVEPTSKKRTKRKFRPPGIWRPEQGDFIILLGCEKSGRIYIPNNAFDLALECKDHLEQGKGSIREHI